jgi:hypothetical protein
MVVDSLRRVMMRLEMAEQARGASGGGKLNPTRMQTFTSGLFLAQKGHKYLSPWATN